MGLSIGIYSHSDNLGEFSKQHRTFGEAEEFQDSMDLLLVLIWNGSQYPFMRVVQRFRQ